MQDTDFLVLVLCAVGALVTVVLVSFLVYGI